MGRTVVELMSLSHFALISLNVFGNFLFISDWNVKSMIYFSHICLKKSVIDEICSVNFFTLYFFNGIEYNR